MASGTLYARSYIQYSFVLLIPEQLLIGKHERHNASYYLTTDEVNLRLCDNSWQSVEISIHRYQVKHICVSTLGNFCFRYALSSLRRNTMISTNADLLSIRPLEQTSLKFVSEVSKVDSKCRLQNGGHFVSASKSVNSMVVSIFSPNILTVY